MVSVGQERVGPYRLARQVISGQTSQIWEAVHETTRERFAIKMLLGEYRLNKEHMGYLKHEYDVGKPLSHPRVVRFFELGTHQRSPYLVMEYFDYPNLKQYLHRGADRLAPFVPGIVRQAAEGLAYLNEQGWIHRDVKPDNFLMSFEGDVKLIDFALAYKIRSGLGKLFGGGAKQVQGTLSYMAPEQIRGSALDTRADVYSFGCMAFQLVYGKPPFTAPSPNELLQKHLRAAPPRLDAMHKNVTKDFADLIERSLAKRPKDRPESLAAFLRDFTRMRVYKVTPKPVKDE